jgi:hypothetical protein
MIRHRLISALFLFASAMSMAQTAAPPENKSTVYAGVEWGNTDTHRVDAGAVYRFRGVTDFSVAVARADAELPGGQAVSTLATARAVHDFGDIGVGLGMRHGEIDDVSTTLGWFATAFYDYSRARIGQVRIGAEVEVRDSRLASSEFTEDFGPGVGIVSGVSRCEVASTGYLAQITWTRPRWTFTASGRGYDYADYDCEMLSSTVVNVVQPGRGRGRALGRQLAAGALQGVSGFASRLFPRESTLLESSVSVGAMLPIDERWYGGIELYRDVEKIDDNAYSTALAFAGVRLDATWNTEFSLGHTSADAIEDTTFVGIRFTADL